jgi:hypothetical protein
MVLHVWFSWTGISMCCVITAVLAFIVWLCPGALARMFSNDPVGVALESRSHPYSRGCFTWYAHASFCALHVPLEQQRHPSCGGQRSSAAGGLGDALVYCVGPPPPTPHTAHRLTHSMQCMPLYLHALCAGDPQDICRNLWAAGKPYAALRFPACTSALKDERTPLRYTVSCMVVLRGL